ncbi:hypothetical protein ABEB36_008581 [Hypothenemus hampei]|uniref:Peroxisome biogenesis factor 2 n=1 Tax=Hypothenemus hampei TaxID=57062 RepID=A0ABD1EMD4_HYPHA
MSKNNLLRVTQMNAIYLDQEIERSFQEMIQIAIKGLPPKFVSPFVSEINLLLRIGLIKYSIFNKGSTFGQQLLSIRYKNMTTLQKSLYLILATSDYVKTKCETSSPSHKVNSVIFKIYILIKILDFVNISLFLKTGVKPRLIERLLGLNQEYATENQARTFESKYMARELLWNGFIEILLYVIPLINYYKLRRLLRQYNPFGHKYFGNTATVRQKITINSKCAHCGENPILPHHMGCAHVFCYVCLKANQAVDPKYECPSCGHRNQDILCDLVKL